jgi:hypothetical protein
MVTEFRRGTRGMSVPAGTIEQMRVLEEPWAH